MKIQIYLFLLPLFFLLSCSKGDDVSIPVITYSSFKENLKLDMTYNTIVEKFGTPSNDFGSGIHIYVYQLLDSTEIWIGYSDKIIYARHLDANHCLLNSIFEDFDIPLTIDYFKDNIDSEMDYASIIEKFGIPLNDLGSGIHIYVYQLVDFTEVWIGFTDKIFYVKHMDKNHQLIENII